MSGRKILVAMLSGLGIGFLIGIFLSRVVANTPTDIDPAELRTLRWLLGSAGALSGVAIESMRQLQAASPDPAYKRQSRRGR
jgi:hypothetical protein